MRPNGVLSAAAVFLLLGLTGPASARQNPEEKPQKQEQPTKPPKQEQQTKTQQKQQQQQAKSQQDQQKKQQQPQQQAKSQQDQQQKQQNAQQQQRQQQAKSQQDQQQKQQNAQQQQRQQQAKDQQDQQQKQQQQRQQQAKGQQDQQQKQQNAQQQQRQQQAKSQQDQQQKQQQQRQQQAKSQQDQQQKQQNAQQQQRTQQQYRPQQAKTQSPQEQHRQQTEQQGVWQERRAQNWQSEHRDWEQRGGYNGYRIPQDHYSSYFGPSHSFRMYSYPVAVVGGYPRFQYGGYYFNVVDPWPQYWPNDWYANDDVYVEYYGGGYYLHNRRYPQDRIAISVNINGGENGGWGVMWRQHRAHNWQSEHRDWQQRGGYNGYQIPEDSYSSYFGPEHSFRMSSYPVTMVGGYPRFQYGDFYFSVVDPWPEYWSDNWYDNDDMYIDYSGDGYYLYNRRYPQDRIAITVYAN
jgi:hypothetical protein